MDKHSGARWVWILATMAMAWGWAVPARSQDGIPYEYSGFSTLDIPLARLDKPAEQIARETSAADIAEDQCDRGTMAGCTALGRAFLFGEGRPQNRPVAELLLRQACDGAETGGCIVLGKLLRSIRVPEMSAAGRLALGRACRLGNLDGCADEADAAESDGDPQAAMAIRQQACAKDGVAACRDMGAHLSKSDDPQQREAGERLLERKCRSGDGQSCGLIFNLVRQNAELAQELAGLGCDSGVPDLCREVGGMLFTTARADQTAGSDGDDEALARLDRACALGKMFCDMPAMIRAKLALEEGCERNQVQADCVALGEIYAREDSPLYYPKEAAFLLGAACEKGAVAACGAAARAIDKASIIETVEDHDSILRFYDIGCRGGSNRDCETLGRNLLEVGASREQRQQGYDLLALACERGGLNSCDIFDHYAKDDPTAPIIPADGRFVPIATQLQAAEPEPIPDSEQEADEERNTGCRYSQIEFRGTIYTDEICPPPVVRVTRGRLAKDGEAPWQALLWRPSFMVGRTLGASERVECGGALIRHGWILTAAHCVVDGDRKPILTKGYRIRLGTYFAQQPDGLEYEIKGIYAHPDYKLKSRTFDIALLQLELGRRTRIGSPRQIRSIEFDQIPVEQRAFPAGSPVRVFGWGHTTFQGNTSNALKVAELQLEAQHVCEESTGTAMRSRLKASLLCAKAADRSQACDADSGGPLVMYEKNRMNVARPLLVGVVNAGKECGRRGDATRYTRVAKMAGWIRDVLAGKGQPIAPR